MDVVCLCNWAPNEKEEGGMISLVARGMGDAIEGLQGKGKGMCALLTVPLCVYTCE